MPSLRAGGAEGVIVRLANGLAEKAFIVQIALTKWNEIQYSLNESINISYIGIENASAIQQIRFIRSMMKQNSSQIVISFITMQNLYTILAAWGVKSKIILSERNDPSKTVRNKILKWLRDILYLRADNIVFQTQDAQNYFKKSIRDKGVVIGNPLSKDMPPRHEGVREKRLVTVARLEPQKNIPMLLDVCKNVIAKHPDFKLEIYGVGNLEQELKEYSESIGIAESVTFMGYVDNIPEKIRTATAFLLTSDYEGISNAMLEALAVGLPCICTDCPIGGARTYIQSMQNGILVPVRDKDKFTEAVLKIIEDKDLQENLGNKASAITDKLSIDKILEKWISLFE